MGLYILSRTYGCTSRRINEGGLPSKTFETFFGIGLLFVRFIEFARTLNSFRLIYFHSGG